MALISDNIFYNAVAIVIVLFVGVITFFKWKYTYWQRKGVPSATPTIPFGNLKDMFTQTKHIGLVIAEIYEEARKKGYKHMGAYLFARPAYVAIDTEVIKHILLKDFSYFMNRRSYHNEKGDPLSAHLFSLEGEKWKNLRQKLTPTFTTGQLKYMFSTLADCAKNLEAYLEKNVNEPLNVKEILCRFTTDVIGSCAFGIECNTLENPDSDFRKYGKLVFEQSFAGALKLLITTTFPPEFLRFINFKSTNPGVAKFFMNVVKDVVSHRETNNVHRKDFMDLLLQLKNRGTLTTSDSKNNDKAPITFTMEEIAAQSFIFYAAGFETSSTTMNFALFELSQNQDIQDKVREEIRTVLKRHDGIISYDSIMEMQYLGNVVDETLRKYPPGSLLNRICSKAYHIPGSNLTLDKGSEIIIPVWGLHRDPEYYPKPEVFDPDRFLPENKMARPSFAYLPFGDGPRNCIGLRFGLMQSRVGLATLLKNFKFVISSKTQLPLVIDPAAAVLTPKNDIWLEATQLS